MNLAIYDIGLLIIFAIFVGIFLYRNRKKIQKEGLLFLYRTSWGIKLIEKTGQKYKKTLKFLSYVSITVGYLLMVGVLYIVGRIVYIYAFRQDIVRAIKIPPITPLFPYIDKVVPNLGLPKFYFIYFIIILAVIAITHEFAHGIFAARNNVRIKKTGFGFFPFFLPIFLAAFVELDEKNMEKKSKFAQMAVLSAGTFVNLLTAIVFFGVLVLLFFAAFTPSGVVFNTYAYGTFGISNISSVNGIPVLNATYDNILALMNNDSINKVQTYDGQKYLADKSFLENLGEIGGQVGMYYDAPAINSGIEPGSIILSVNDDKITGFDSLQQELYQYSPGDNIILTTKFGGEIKDYEITLAEHPEYPQYPYIGVASTGNVPIIGDHRSVLPFIGKSGIYYQSKGSSGVALFIYTLIEWLVLISFSIALINMLPVGIFDGGRFFYLTIFALTKNKIKSEKTFRIVTRIFLFLLLFLMILWAMSFF